MAPSLNHRAHADQQAVLRLEGVRDVFAQVSQPAREEFLRRIHELVDMSKPDASLVTRTLRALHSKHAEEADVVDTHPGYGKGARSVVSFKSNGTAIDGSAR